MLLVKSLASFYLFGKSHIYKLKMAKVVPKVDMSVSSNLCAKPNIKIKSRNTNTMPPAFVNFQVLGAGANGAPTCVFLFTEQTRYLFNCGEGTQRLAHEHKTRLTRLDKIFLTRNSWSAIGGLPGLLLTIQDCGISNLGIYGPPHLKSLIESMRKFVVLKTLKVNSIDCTQSTVFEDNVMSIKAVSLYSNAEADILLNKVAICYICKLKPRPGSLILEKCVERGVTPGPLLGQLKNGMDITLPDGRIVRSVDVTEPDETELTFVIIDVPTINYLPALQQHSDTFKMLGKDVITVMHFSPSTILENDCYSTFIKENFQPNVQHLYMNSRQIFSGYAAVHRIQYQLNQLSPTIFPLLDEARNYKYSIEGSQKSITMKDNTNGLQNENDLLSTMSIFHIRPNKGIDRTLEIKLTPDVYLEEAFNQENFAELLDKLRQQQNAQIVSEAPVYPKITFLGTGSCIPNKTRNVSSILLQTSADTYALLDCGEGTLGQIIRFFGPIRSKEILRNLRIIYISHLHADHHIGLISFLKVRQQLKITVPLLLLAPIQMKTWLDFYDKCIDNIQDAYTLIGNAKLLENPLTFVDQPEYGIAGISTCFVRHCPHSFGVSFTMHESYNEKPIKITYSGDTMPCEDLIQLGYESTILIHEATMEDRLINEAIAKTHSTVSQAINQGQKMKAAHIILTHFSQRYAKCPVWPTNEPNDMQNIVVAFDNAQFTLASLKQFHLLYPVLYALFANYTEELEKRAEKRELKNNLKRKMEEM